MTSDSMRGLILALSGLAIVSVGCRRGTESTVDPPKRSVEADLIVDEVMVARVRREANPSVEDAALFRRLLAERTGLDWVPKFPVSAPSAMISDHYSGNGLCVGDVDLDGLPDIFLTNYDQGNRLYRNLGDFRFEDITDTSGVGGETVWSAGPCLVDIDNDNDLDLFVASFNAPNRLYVNQGDGRFVEQARQRGIDFAGASVMMVFADYDQDGDLDGYLVTHRMNIGKDFEMPKSTRDAVKRGIVQQVEGGARVTARYRELFQLVDRGEGRIELAIAGQQDLLYQNDGRGNFRVVNPQANIAGYGIGLAASWWDYNEDGRVDLYVSNDYKGTDQLYRNEGNGRFGEVAAASLPHVPWFSMGSATADINNDGRVDLLASDMSGTSHYRQKVAMGDMQDDLWFLRATRPAQYMRNALFLGTGTERLMEVAHLAGVANSDWTWSPLFGDLDNDGWIDLYISNGMSRDFMDSDLRRTLASKQSADWLSRPVLRERNLALRNTGDLYFQATGDAWGLNQLTASYGAALADLDRDGDLDVIATDFEQPLLLFENRNVVNRSIVVRLIGQSSNRWGVGAKVQIQSAAGLQTRTLTTTQGVMSSAEPLVHFGIGKTSQVERLSVQWPSGHQQTFFNLAADRMYSITEPSTAPLLADTASQLQQATPLFREPDTELSLRHRENEFDDFELQPLLPAKISKQGPGMSVGDVNGDGVEDLFLGGAAGHPGQIVDGRSRGVVPNACFTESRESEQLGSVFLDVDNDGDLDLYVATGGVEYPSGNAAYRDELYMNEGEGRFALAANDLSDDQRQSASCVAAADYDRDGDVDLFVGGFATPGRYPTSPASRLLKNEGGRLVRDKESWAAENTTATRVTSAIWSDVDGDDWIDLLVTQQWGPVRLYKNAEGQLREVTEASGLGSWKGWWNGIAAGDLDADGDIDYVVTNQGLNSKYRASHDHPTALYYGDFEGLGDLRIVEATYEHDVLYPVRGLSCSSAAIPSLGKKFESFHQFASASLNQVYTEQALGTAMHLTANTLDSGILWNEGESKFRFAPLPRIAQVSAGFGVIVQDFNGDGHNDIYLVHNSFSPQAETGNIDGGLSQLLLGDSLGNFRPIGPAESGLIVPGDAKSVVVVDQNQDRRPDLLVGVNDSAVREFENSVDDSERFLQVTLRRPVGNVDGAGARVTLYFDDGSKSVAEVYSGGGYLSQSTRTLTFGLGERAASAVEVRWPDGTETRREGPFEADELLVLSD